MDNLLNLIRSLVEKIVDTANSVRLLIPKYKQKTGVVGRIEKDFKAEVTHSKETDAIHNIDLSTLEKISSKKIVLLIALLIGGIALTSIVLWVKLTNFSKGSGPDHSFAATTLAVIQEESTGFLPGKTIRVEKKRDGVKQKTATQPDEKKEYPSRAVVKSQPAIDHKDQPSEPLVKKDLPVLKRIMPSSHTAYGISQTINPQYLVENPILKVQKAVIILKGFGLNKIHSDAILDQIYEDIVVAIDPYTTGLQNEVETLSDYGLDVLVMIPLEDTNPYKDQGYLTVRTAMQPNIREKILSSILDASIAAQGILLTGGRKLLKSSADVQSLVTYLSDHNKFVVLGDDVLNNKFFKMADSSRLNYLVVAADECPISAMDQVLGVVRRTGFVVLSFDINTPDVVDKIKQWIKVLDDNKIDVVSISNLLKEND
jgi:polysaccharide deacetylase 2 family uncharacterized protein YibQ